MSRYSELVQRYHQRHGDDAQQSRHRVDGAGVFRVAAVDLSHLTVKMVIRRMDCYGTENPQHTWRNKPEEWEELRRLRNTNEDALLTEV